MDKKARVYFCTGCGIGDALDMEALAKAATKQLKEGDTKSHPFLCGPEGRALLDKDITSDGINTLIIAACSIRAQTEAFRFESTCVVERVSLREQVAWVAKPNDEDTQMLAEDYIRMGCVRALKSEPLEPTTNQVTSTVLVVGGGVTGLAAALDIVAAGHRAVLVEKSDQLGGWVGRFGKKFPTRPPYDALVENDITQKTQAVEQHPDIRVYKSASIQSIAGQPGEFDVELSFAGTTTTEHVGAIVLATGWQPYDATKLSALGYGRSKNVVTNVELEQQLASGELRRGSDGSRPRSVLFIQCAGSRDPDHLPYCSSVCCRTSLKQARRIRELMPDTSVYVLYRDIRTPGQYELFYKSAQEDPGIFLAKGDVTGVTVEDDGSMTVEVSESLLGEQVSLNSEMVVLATGMVPRSDEPMLNLTYRLGKELPLGRYGFPDSDFICFPYETQRTGIYAAGCIREPLDSDACTEDAAGAVLKAIQCVNMTARGVAVHPRAGDLSVPDFFLQRCTQCKRCTEECPFGTLDEDEKGTPLPNPNRCRRCGICMGACPERIISFKNYSVEIVGSAIKAIEVPDEFEEKPRYIALVCENDILPALDLAAAKRKPISPSVRFIPVRCLGSTNLQWINDALIKGFDGVMLIGCRSGEDYQCHFIKGSELCGTRMSKIQETLERLMLEPERIGVHEMPMGDYEMLPDWINEFVEKVDELGPNPNKGF